MSQTRVFQCPSCREFIATDAATCRFCSNPIDAHAAQSAADAQADENRIYRRKQYAKHIRIGGSVFGLGLGITLLTYLWAELSDLSGNYVITYGMMLGGGGDLLYGLVGWIGELKK